MLNLDVMVRKANVLAYIWSFSENLENSKKIDLMMRRLDFGGKYVK